MVEVSIICLVYKSTRMAKAVYESVQKYTPMLKSGRAEFFFVANDPTKDVVEFLRKEKIPHYININERKTDEELFAQGFATPGYMQRVYRGYNYGVMKARGQKIVLINSDNFFSINWLENLQKYLEYGKVVTSTLVEPGNKRFTVFPFAIKKNFGRTLDDYDERGFAAFAEKVGKTGFTRGGAYMPCLMYKDIAIYAGLYPEGNIAGADFRTVKRYGDEDFYERLRSFGVEHITAKDSVVYHLKEGEKAELVKAGDSEMYVATPTKDYVEYGQSLKAKPTKLLSYIKPDEAYDWVIQELGRKVTALIIFPKNASELSAAVKSVRQTEYNNIEISVIADEKHKGWRRQAGVKYVFCNKDKLDLVLYRQFHHMYGEYLLPIYPDTPVDYSADAMSKIDGADSLFCVAKTLPSNAAGSDLGDVANYVLPKRLLLDNISVFLERLVWHQSLQNNDVLGREIIMPPDGRATPLKTTEKNRSLLVRGVRLVRREGAKGVIRRILK